MQKQINKVIKVGTMKSGVDLERGDIPFPVVANVRQVVNYRIFLYGETSSAFDFAEAINAIENTAEGDEVTIYLSGGGGCVSSTDAFLHAINTAQERGIHVHCVASGLVASAHTFIILSCSSYECAAGTHFLFHNGSLGDGGSYNQFKASSQFFLKYMETRFREVYEFFLSEKELDDILEGKDMWLTAKQFHERYSQRNTLMEEAMKAEEGGVQDVPAPPPITTEMVKEAAKVGDQQFQEYCDTHQKIIDRNVVTLEKINYDEEMMINNAAPLSDDEGWYEWGKPEFPSFIEADTRVDMDYEDGEYYREEKAGELTWGTVGPDGMEDIVERFRICK